jgi:hypothetical protein
VGQHDRASVGDGNESRHSTDLGFAPPPFTNAAGERVVFVDFTEAEYDLRFDAGARTAQVVSTIRFESDANGHPALCFWQPVLAATLDGSPVELREERPPGPSAPFRSLSRSVSAGAHTLSITSDLTGLGPTFNVPVRWYGNPDRLHCMFDMSDLDRQGRFLDAYLASNYEYDHFRMTFRVKVVNSSTEHRVFANGVVTGTGRNEWRVEYPSYFTTSSPWFNLGAKVEYRILESAFLSQDGRTLPVLVYTTTFLTGLRLETFQDAAHTALRALEADFGPFPHPSATVFASGINMGGMEYAGATTADLGSLRHELDHSYFARSITPANGDAGWVDEAIASWGDVGYPWSTSPPSGAANMGARSPYIRETHISAYTLGRDFLKHLDYLLRDVGGLKRFLARYAERNRHMSVTALDFQRQVEGFLGSPLGALFDRHVYGVAPAADLARAAAADEADPHAPRTRLADVALPPESR